MLFEAWKLSHRLVEQKERRREQKKKKKGRKPISIKENNDTKINKKYEMTTQIKSESETKL